MDTTYNLEFAISHSHEVMPLVDDSCKAEILFVIGDVYLGLSKSDSTRHYFDKANELAAEINSEYLLTKGHLMEAVLQLHHNDVEQAKKTLAPIPSMLEKLPTQVNLWIRYYSQLNVIANSEANYQDAIDYVNIMIDNGYYTDSIELANHYHNIGLAHLRLTNYPSSSENLLKAVEINKQITGGNLTANYYVLGYAYGKWEQLEPAISYLRKANELSRRDENDIMVARTYVVLSSFYRKSNRSEEAINAIDSALYLFGPIDNSFELSKAYLEKGRVNYYLLEQYEVAESLYRQAREFAKKSHTLPQYAPALELVILNLKKRNLKYAKMYLDELELICEKLNRKDYDAAYYEQASKYYEQVGDESTALNYFKRFHETNDSIANADVISQVAGMEKRFDSKQKELDILKLNQEKKEQLKLTAEATFLQKVYAGIAGLLGLLFFSILYFARKLKMQKSALELAHSELGKTNQVKDRLFSIIAHDVRGMIIPFQRAGKVLNYHLKKGNTDRVAELSTELEKNSEGLNTMLDNLLKWSLEQMNGYNLKNETLNIREELQAIMDGYAQHASFKNNTLEIISASDDMITFDKGAFHVIFRNLIGNALKYTEAGSIKADWKKTNTEIQVTISDTGIGMTPEQKQNLFDLNKNESSSGTAGEKGTGLGLHLVHQFATKLHGNIKVNSQPGHGSQFVLTFPQT